MLDSLPYSNADQKSSRGNIDEKHFDKHEVHDHTIKAVQKWLSISCIVGKPSYRVFCNFMSVSYNEKFFNKKGVLEALKQFYQSSKNNAIIQEKDWTNAFHQANNVVQFISMKC